MCMKEFGSQKSIIDKMAAMSTLTFFRLVTTKRGYTCSMIVHTRAEELQKLIMDKMTVMRTWTIFPDCVRG